MALVRFSRLAATAIGVCWLCFPLRVLGQSIVSLEQPVWIKLRDKVYRVPRGFVSDWPKPNTRDESKSEVSFVFWMPDLRFVEVRSSSILGFRPKEKDRSATPESFIVRVIGLKDIEVGYVSPAQGFQNLAGPDPSRDVDAVDEPFGLKRFWRLDYPYSNRAFDQYVRVGADGPQLLLRCTPQERSPPAPICDGKVQLIGENLTFHISFPKEQLPNWNEIVTAVTQLLKRWKERE